MGQVEVAPADLTPAPPKEPRSGPPRPSPVADAAGPSQLLEEAPAAHEAQSADVALDLPERAEASAASAAQESQNADVVLHLPETAEASGERAEASEALEAPESQSADAVLDLSERAERADASEALSAHECHSPDVVLDLPQGATQESQADDGRHQCNICFENRRDVRFQPCGHLVCCSDCSKSVTQCPLCRAQIHRRDPIHKTGLLLLAAGTDEDLDLEATFAPELCRKVPLNEREVIQPARGRGPAVFHFDWDDSIDVNRAIRGDPREPRRIHQVPRQPDNSIGVDPSDLRVFSQDSRDSESPVLGRGNYTNVYRDCHARTGQPVAIKSFKMDGSNERQQFLEEVRKFMGLECGGLVTIHGGFFLTRDRRWWYYQGGFMVMEFMDVGSVRSWNARRSQQGGSAMLALPGIAQHILEGLTFLHERHIIHREVSQDNILLNSQGQAKLAEPGMSAGWEARMNGCGNHFAGGNMLDMTMSPERCLGQDYCAKSDMWSLGVVLHDVVVGKHCFQATSFLQILDLLCEQPEPRLDPEVFSPAMCDFVAKCLTRDVAARAESSSLREHDFVCRDVPDAALLGVLFCEGLSSAQSTSA